MEETGCEGRHGKALETRPAVAHRCSLCLSLLLSTVREQSFGEAGRQSVMPCQQCSDGSLTYFRKYHRISIYNRAEPHVSSHIPHGLEHSQTFSNLKCAFLKFQGLLNICGKQGLLIVLLIPTQGGKLPYYSRCQNTNIFRIIYFVINYKQFCCYCLHSNHKIRNHLWTAQN